MSERYDKGRLYEENDGELTFEVLDDGNALYYNEDGITELLNNLNDENEQLKKENMDLKQERYNAIQLLKKEFDLAHQQRQKYLNDVVLATAYNIIKYTMREALEKLGDFE